MIVLSRAPFLAVLTGLVTTLALSGRVAAWALPLLALLAVLGMMLVSYREKFEGQQSIALFTLALALLFSLWIVFSLNRPLSLPSRVDTTGVVVESRPWGRFYAVALKTRQGGFVLRLPFESLTEGDRIHVTGVPRPFRSNSSGFREDYFWRARGMTAQLTSAQTEVLPYRGLRDWTFYRWRHALYRSIVLHMPPLTGAYLNAVWTGKRDMALQEIHRAAGTSHLLAVSGFHVGLVVGAASFVFRRGRGRVLGLSLLLWSYIFLTGTPASAVRAGLMIQTALLGEWFGRPGNALNSVSLAGSLLLLHSPFWFWDVGWRLSVLAALSIAAVVEFRSSNDWKTWLLISPLVWIVTLPQASGTFDSAPLAGIVINLAAPQFFGFAMMTVSCLGLVRLLNMPVLTPLTDALLYAAEGVFSLWGTAAEAVIRAIPWQVEWSPLLAWSCAVISIGLLCRALFIPGRGIVILAPLGALAALVLFGGR